MPGFGELGREVGIVRDIDLDLVPRPKGVVRYCIVGARGETRDREADAREQEQRHEQAHDSTATDEAPSGYGRRCSSVLHTVLLSDLIRRNYCIGSRVTGVTRKC